MATSPTKTGGISGLDGPISGDIDGGILGILSKEPSKSGLTMDNKMFRRL